MSFHDLETAVAGFLAEQARTAQGEATRNKRKVFRRERSKRGPAPQPLATVTLFKRVVLLVRPSRPVPLAEWSGSTADWARQESQVEYQVPTISGLIAEIEARKLAKANGWLWQKTVAILDGSRA